MVGKKTEMGIFNDILSVGQSAKDMDMGEKTKGKVLLRGYETKVYCYAIQS